MNNNFAENLKKIRKDYKLSQEQLAEELGVSRQAISKWESAAAYPEMEKIIALCDKFNLNVDDLLHRDIREAKGEEESKKNINKYIDDFLNFITDTINLFSNMSFKSKIKCLFEEAIVIFVLFMICLAAFYFIKHLLFGILGILPSGIFGVISSIIECVILLILSVVSIIIFIHVFKTRYLDYYHKLKKENLSLKNNSESDISELNKSINIDDCKEKKHIIIRDPKHSEYKFINALFKFTIFILKIFSLCFALGLCILLVFFFFCFTVSFTVYKTGMLFIGLLGSTLSISIIDSIFILIILNFVFNRKNDKKKIIFLFIYSLVTLGVSLGLIFGGMLKFDVDDNYMLENKTIEYEMNDALFFDLYQDFEYVESNIDNVKLEYKIFKFCDVDNIKDDNRIEIWGYCSNPIRLIREVIKNLNNRKIIYVNNNIEDVKIYASKENIEILKENQMKYYNSQKERDDIISSYESIIDDYEDRIYNLENELSFYKSINEQ